MFGTKQEERVDGFLPLWRIAWRMSTGNGTLDKMMIWFNLAGFFLWFCGRGFRSFSLNVHFDSHPKTGMKGCTVLKKKSPPLFTKYSNVLKIYYIFPPESVSVKDPHFGDLSEDQCTQLLVFQRSCVHVPNPRCKGKAVSYTHLTLPTKA